MRATRRDAYAYASENISFNVRGCRVYARHVPSIDRGRRLARRVRASISLFRSLLKECSELQSCDYMYLFIHVLSLSPPSLFLSLSLSPPLSCARARMRTCVWCANALARVAVRVRTPRQLRARGRLDALPRGLCEASPPARLATDFTRIGRIKRTPAPRSPEKKERKEKERRERERERERKRERERERERGREIAHSLYSGRRCGHRESIREYGTEKAGGRALLDNSRLILFPLARHFDRREHVCEKCLRENAIYPRSSQLF